MMNRACTMKIGWQFWNGGDNLWCDVLGGKYGRRGIVDGTVIIKNADSHIIGKVLERFGRSLMAKDGVLETDQKLVFRMINYQVPNAVCRLTNIIANIHDNIKDWKVKDVGCENGEWNMNIIESVFPCQIRHKMMSILPSHIENGMDVSNWEGTNN
ncbi:hypothetical protein L195_g021117, partial [Trifolium pratense]